MRSIYSTIKRSLILILITVCSAFTVPPYLWYATHSIRNYQSTGCDPYLNLSTTLGDALAFANAVNSLGLSSNVRHVYDRRDAECTASRWSGSYAEINYVDFLFYAGHGCGTGPYLGCSPAYQIKNYSDIRFGGNGYLKWVQAAACKWFVTDSANACETGMDEFERWNNCFQGVHVIQGHRALTFEHQFSDSLAADFWNLWVRQNNTIYNAWRNSQIKWLYERSRYSGLQPATAAHDLNYLNELWQDATDAPAPAGMNCLMWATVGEPLY